MTQATIHQAKTHLSKLIRKALDGEEVIIANRDKPLVRLEAVHSKKSKRQLGWGKGLVTYIAPDFDEPLEDLAEYMEPAEEEQMRRKRAMRHKGAITSWTLTRSCGDLKVTANSPAGPPASLK